MITKLAAIWIGGFLCAWLLRAIIPSRYAIVIPVGKDVALGFLANT